MTTTRTSIKGDPSPGAKAIATQRRAEGRNEQTGEPLTTKATHTPGPWKAWSNGTVTGGYATCGTLVCTLPTEQWAMSQAAQADGTDVAEWLGRCHDESRANARLIAAAPSLLAVLKEIEDHGTDDWDARMRTIKAAIASAT